MKVIGVAIVLALLGSGVFMASQIGLASVYYAGAEAELSFWARPGDYVAAAEDVERVRDQLQRAIDLRPADPDYLEAQASTWLWASYLGFTEHEHSVEQALRLQRKAIDLRPAHGPSKARYEDYLGLANFAQGAAP